MTTKNKIETCKCETRYDCCSCGGTECGCAGCWNCHACENCLSEDEE